jgi:uncharacterized membrane protein YfcA
MSLRQGIHGLVRSRRALILAPLIIVLNSLLVWTLEHTDIVAFATIFVAALVLVSGTFWVTGRATSREIALGEQQSQIVNRLFHPSVRGR